MAYRGRFEDYIAKSEAPWHRRSADHGLLNMLSNNDFCVDSSKADENKFLNADVCVTPSKADRNKTLNDDVCVTPSKTLEADKMMAKTDDKTMQIGMKGTSEIFKKSIMQSNQVGRNMTWEADNQMRRRTRPRQPAHPPPLRLLLKLTRRQLLTTPKARNMLEKNFGQKWVIKYWNLDNPGYMF